MSKCKDLERIQYFNGFRFVQSTDKRYFRCNKLKMSMHRYVWEYYNGTIPEGYIIHHKDGDKANNDISNLECIPRGTHSRLHGQLLTQEEREWRRNNLNINARPAAIDWHKSEEGKKWHKEMSKYRKDNRRISKGICLQCGKDIFSYNNQGHTSKFCSGACQQKYRRQNGLNNIEKVCPVCGKIFKTDRYKPRITCGHSCANKLRWQEGGCFYNRRK